MITRILRGLLEPAPLRPSVEEQQWRDDQKHLWETQIGLAREQNRITLWACIATAIGTITAILVSLSSLYFVWRTLKTAEIQATAAEQNAKLAMRSFDETIKSFQLDQRAWVGIKSTRLIDLVINKPFKAEMYLVNSGKTVARNVYARVTIRSGSEPFNLNNFRQERSTAKGIPSRFVIFPNSEFTLPAYHGNALTEDRLLLIKAGIITVYLFGEITYSDIFGKSHLTEFCNIFRPDLNDFSFCSDGNNAS